MNSLPVQIAEGILLALAVVLAVGGTIALIVWRVLRYLNEAGKQASS